MATNIQINATNCDAVLYYGDGSSEVIDAGTQKQFQLPNGEVCSISDVGEVDETQPHPDNELPQSPQERFAELWRTVVDAIKGQGPQNPTVNPLK